MTMACLSYSTRSASVPDSLKAQSLSPITDRYDPIRSQRRVDRRAGADSSLAIGTERPRVRLGPPYLIANSHALFVRDDVDFNRIRLMHIPHMCNPKIGKLFVSSCDRELLSGRRFELDRNGAKLRPPLSITLIEHDEVDPVVSLGKSHLQIGAQDGLDQPRTTDDLDNLGI